MSSGVGGAEDGSHEISDHLVEKTLLSQDQLQKLFYIRRKGWVTQQHVKEFVAAYDNRLVQASKGSKGNSGNAHSNAHANANMASSFSSSKGKWKYGNGFQV